MKGGGLSEDYREQGSQSTTSSQPKGNASQTHQPEKKRQWAVTAGRILWINF